MKKKLLVIVGPTSSGKSALAVELAKKFDGEIISADSRQVYRGLNIGTGKITKREMRGVRHHLLDVASPKKIFTAHDFVKKARIAIRDITKRGKLPIVVGGTGFYIDTLVGRIPLPDVAVDTELRRVLEKKTASQLFTMLQKTDPRRAQTIDRHNTRRLIRALEIATALGASPAIQQVTPYDVKWIGLHLRVEPLAKKIRARLRARIRTGMISEGKRLHAGGLSYKRMESLGLEYRSLARFLKGEITEAQMTAELDIAICKYARRQITYWKRNTEIQWYAPQQSSIKKGVQKWLTDNS